MLSDEERMAIEHLKNYPINWLIETVNESAIKIILNLIEKQSKEIEELQLKIEKEKEKNKKAIDFINDNNNYFEDGENWQNILKIKEILEE